jgi:eukaryotic-like serine/threonine-protein kinase
MEIERLGPYQIVGRLGRGGMGTVYEAVHRETGEPAAVKLLSGDLAREEAFRGRFEAEIETLRKLNHPNVVRLFGFGEQDGQLFYAMELVDGNSLEEELRRGRRFQWDEVAKIGAETCQALRHAHDRGIIHRDIKPGNILLATDGRIKLSDFGIARLFGYSGLTSAGSVLGTAEYMAPEQAEGRPVDHRADLYSLGGLMYVLLARRPLFQGKSLPEILHKQRHEKPVPVRRYAPDTPEEFEALLLQLLEKDPEARVPNASVLARRLQVMLQALATRLKTLECEVESPSSAAPPSSSAVPSAKPVTDNANTATQIVDASGIELSVAGESSAPPLSPVETTMAATPLPGKVTQRATAAVPRERFTAVSEEELDVVEEEPRRANWWQTGALVLLLISVAAVIWWFLQPPSADSLYKKITAHAPKELTDEILAAEGEVLEPAIRQFLERYPNDSRGKELPPYQKKIDLYNLQRAFDRRVRFAGNEDLLLIEQDYLEAVRYLELEPELGAKRLETLIHLYDPKEDTSGPGKGAGAVIASDGDLSDREEDISNRTKQCLTLARRRLDEVQEIDKNSRDKLPSLLTRLDAADALRASNPEAARRIYRAVVELYDKRAWASDVVRRARESLAHLPPPAKAAAQPHKEPEKEKQPPDRPSKKGP